VFATNLGANIKVFQTIGGAFFVAAAQSAFVNTLLNTLPSVAPDVDPAVVIVTGATEIRDAFSDDQVPGILVAYMAGIKLAFAIAIGGAGFSFLLSLLSKWKRLNREASKQPGEGA
jgi:hypothetical protein